MMMGSLPGRSKSEAIGVNETAGLGNAHRARSLFLNTSQTMPSCRASGGFPPARIQRASHDPCYFFSLPYVNPFPARHLPWPGRAPPGPYHVGRYVVVPAQRSRAAQRRADFEAPCLGRGGAPRPRPCPGARLSRSGICTRYRDRRVFCPERELPKPDTRKLLMGTPLSTATPAPPIRRSRSSPPRNCRVPTSENLARPSSHGAWMYEYVLVVIPWRSNGPAAALYAVIVLLQAVWRGLSRPVPMYVRME